MREISNETCVDVTARLSTDAPQKPDEDQEYYTAQRNSPKRYQNYFEPIIQNDKLDPELMEKSETPRQKAKY